MSDLNRKNILARVTRTVVKVGSGVLTRRNGLNLNVIEDLAADICSLRKRGIEVLLVSSGAIAAGLRKFGLTRKPESLSHKQALAAIGQSDLIRAYEEAMDRRGAKAAQILLTRDDLTNRRRYLNARNTLLTLLNWKIIPIINENDTVTAEEIKFGDNDNLSAMVANLADAQLLVTLTDIDGLYDKDPRGNPDAEMIRIVEQVDRRITRVAGSIAGSVGTGGMASKVSAAKKAALAGIPTIIANGLKTGILKEIFSGKEVGTLVLAGGIPLCSRKHWIAFTKSPKGAIVVDRGAENALVQNGKSLLPSGIVAVIGRFTMGNSVVLKSEAGEELAVGVVNYDSAELDKIKGKKTSAIEPLLGYTHGDEVIHRNNLILTSRMQEQEDLCPSKAL
jgi:glutamate 5-kinase